MKAKSKLFRAKNYMLRPFASGLVILRSIITFAVFSFFSCSGSYSLDANQSPEKVEELSVLNWNVQTFFDSVNDGCEYDEFISCKSWGAEAYSDRLTKLASSIKKIDADLIIMEEIENEGVIYDIANFLAGEWNQKKIYRYACFAKDEKSSIGCGVLSRYPLENLTLHALDVKNCGDMPKMRPLMQLSVCKNGKKLVLLVNHWKSMSGGEEETDLWRLWQESVLCNRIMELCENHLPVLVSGDFNRDINGFKNTGKKNEIILRERATEDCESGVTVKSPWFDAGQNPVEPGSYYFRDEWSRIDNFFTAGPAEIIDFHPMTDGPWCNQETFVPEKFQIWNSSGYSDHLPIFCRVRF